MGESEIGRFLSDLATRRRVSPSTQNQALSALLFLYRKVPKKELDFVDGIVRAKPHIRLPVVLTKSEVHAVLENLHGTYWLMASLPYGARLRLMECARPRIKNIDFDRNEITIRDGKSRMDRVTLLPASLKEPLTAHVREARRLHHNDLLQGNGSVELPEAIERK